MLHRLPVMTRGDLQETPEDFRANNRTVFKTDATGGSTGTPMSFDVDEDTHVSREASLMWANHLAGWRLGDRIAMLWGADQDVSAGMADMRLRLRCWIENRRWFNAFNMGMDQMGAFHKALSRFRPHIIVAYAGAAFEYARYLDSCDIVPQYPTKAVITSAEVLTETMRRKIESVFPAPVFNRYGNRESGAIAAECSIHDGLHVRDRHVIVEISRPGGSSIPGRVLVTSLDNYVMPLIRYDTGDLAELVGKKSCKCGVCSPCLDHLEGRQSDLISTPEGKVVHGEFFTHLMYGQDGVHQFQFVQKASDQYVLLVKASKEDYQSKQAAWLTELQQVLGEKADITITRVDQIRPLSSGKYRFTAVIPDLSG
jgi:phenylacetate-CoA ligase